MEQASGRSWWFFAVAAFAIAAMQFAYGLWSPTLQRRQELSARKARLEAQVRGLWNRNVHLERARDAMMYDPVMVESVARGQLGYRRPGEIVHPPAEGLAASRVPEQKEFAEPCALALTIPKEASAALPDLDGALNPSFIIVASGLLLFALVADAVVRAHPKGRAASPRS